MLRFCFDAGLDVHRLDGALAHVHGDLTRGQGTRTWAALRRALPQLLDRKGATRFRFFLNVLRMLMCCFARSPVQETPASALRRSQNSRTWRFWSGPAASGRGMLAQRRKRPRGAAKGAAKACPQVSVHICAVVRFDCLCVACLTSGGNWQLRGHYPKQQRQGKDNNKGGGKRSRQEQGHSAKRARFVHF